MRVLVLTRRQVEDGTAQGADAVISIRSPGARDTATLDEALEQAVLGDTGAVLRLTFDDIGVPEFGSQRGPTQAQVDAAIDFGRQVRTTTSDPLIVVHCEMGRSRSAGLALGLLADVAGAGGEKHAITQLLRLDAEGIMVPNPLLVRQIDTALWRYGALETALLETSPAYSASRSYWQQVAADPEKAWSALRSKRRMRAAYRGRDPDDA